MNSRRGVASALAVTALLFGACSTGGGPHTTGATSPRRRRTTAARPAATAAAAVEIDWYHIQNNDPGKALWQTLADEYTAAHPNVKINLNVIENEAFKTKLTTLVQADTPPDLFQSWGGGGLREQVEAGLVQDITAACRVVGRTRSIPAPWACTRSTESSTASRSTLAWSASGTTRTSSTRPASPSRRRPGMTSSPTSADAQGRRAHADRAGRQGHLDGRLLLGLPRRPRMRQGGHGQGRHDRRLDAIRASSRPARTSWS